MRLTISRWGNSLAVRLPKEALDRADLHEGDILEVGCGRGEITLTRVRTGAALNELIDRITPENRHGEVFTQPVGAETW